LPRLAVLSVLSAASSPCPDLNLIHYKKKDKEKDKGKNRRPVSDDGVYLGSYPPASEEGGYSVPQDSGYSDRGW